METFCAFPGGVYLRIEYGYNDFHSFYRCEVAMYIDPNTGGILFAALAAVFTTLSGVLLIFSGRIRKFIAGMRRKMRKDQSEEQE
jgi:hypothetical protein